MHLYIHVPFCLRRCSYCDFAIAVRKHVPDDRFIAAILAERDLRAAAEGWHHAEFETVYLGGGTPSRLSPDAVTTLIAAFPRAGGAEVTLEANPEDVTQDAASAWRTAGVNRVSLGVQSFDPDVLAWMRRPHTAQAPARAVGLLRDAGIPQVSVDLIFALPDELDHDVARDVAMATELMPEHVSAYGLTLETGTPYARLVDRRQSSPPADDRYAAEFLLVHDRLNQAGYEHYEVSNYARREASSSHRARHNGAYWAGHPYIGLGPAAHGFSAGRRRWNEREWTRYEQVVRKGNDPVAGQETLTAQQGFLETVYLGLRSAGGLEPATAGRLNRRATLAAAAAGWLTEEQGWIRATPQGWLVLDELTRTLTTFPESG